MPCLIGPGLVLVPLEISEDLRRHGFIISSVQHNPHTGTYGRGASVYGPYGGSAAYQAYNPRTNTGAAGYRSANAYSSWGEGVVQRGDKWAHGGYYSDSRGTVAGVHTSEGDRAVAARSSSGRAVIAGSGNNVYAGKNGQVYKRGNGGWSKYDDGKWNSVSTSQRASQNRAEVQNRTSQAASSPQKGTGATSPQRRASATTSPQRGAQATQRSSSQRAEIQDRASLDRAAQAGWQRTTSQGDVLRQLDADSRARAQGSQRAQQYRAQGGAGAQSRSRAGRSRGGRRGRGG